MPLMSVCFNPRALTSPDRERYQIEGFLKVSIHGLLRALTLLIRQTVTPPFGFNPRALTSPDWSRLTV